MANVTNLSVKVSYRIYFQLWSYNFHFFTDWNWFWKMCSSLCRRRFSKVRILHSWYSSWICASIRRRSYLRRVDFSFKYGLQICEKSDSRRPKTLSISKWIIFYGESRFSGSRELEEAKMTNLSPLASQRLKLMPILLFLDFKFVPLYPGPKNPKFSNYTKSE